MPHPKASRLGGLLTAILSPFGADNRFLPELLPVLLDFQRAAGVDGVVVCGTNGEGTSLSVSERKQALETVLEHRGRLQVIAATGATSLPDAIELTRHAAEAGADAALILPPFFWKNPSAEGLANYFRPVLDCADLPMLLYSIPQMTSVPITDIVLKLLADHPNLSGVKDSAGEWPRTHELITKDSDLRIFAGHDTLAARCYAAGGAGCISGGANPFPELAVAVRDACRIDPYGTKAARAQERLTQMISILARYPFVGASKSVLAHRGLPRMSVRPSLVNLTGEQEARMIAEFKDAGFLP